MCHVHELEFNKILQETKTRNVIHKTTLILVLDAQVLTAT